MTSGSDVDSTRVEAVMLAAGSQHMCQDQQTQSKNLLVPSMPPTYSIRRPNRLYGDVMRRWRHGRIKTEPIKANTARKDKSTHLECIRTAQPPINAPNTSRCAYRVIGLRRRRSRMKIKTVKLEIKRINDKSAREDKRTYLERAQATQPPPNVSKRLCRVHTPRHQRG